jgi:hypothetical protein
MFDLHEARQIQEGTVTSAANGIQVTSPTVPAGKLWTIIAAACFPSVNETKIVQWCKFTRGVRPFAITVPQSMALGAAIFYPLLTEGNTLELYPGEAIQASRDSATAGSTIAMVYQYVESDLPFYAFDEPMKKLVQKRNTRAIAAVMGGVGSSLSGGLGAGRGGRTGRGGSEPI